MTEAGLARFGDKRLGCVGGALLAAMQRKRTMCAHRLAGTRNQPIQFGRFLANPAVTAQEMLANAGCLTNQRVTGRHVLANTDTTDLRFATHEASKRGFGRDANETPAPACSCTRFWRWRRGPEGSSAWSTVPC